MLEFSENSWSIETETGRMLALRQTTKTTTEHCLKLHQWRYRSKVLIDFEIRLKRVVRDDTWQNPSWSRGEIRWSLDYSLLVWKGAPWSSMLFRLARHLATAFFPERKVSDTSVERKWSEEKEEEEGEDGRGRSGWCESVASPPSSHDQMEKAQRSVHLICGPHRHYHFNNLKMVKHITVKRSWYAGKCGLQCSMTFGKRSWEKYRSTYLFVMTTGCDTNK